MAGILKVDQVQSDSNLSFQVAGANVAYMNSTGLQMTGGQIVAGGNTLLTASGLIYANAGIAFPATQVSSADANTLDDYEEGSWTPEIWTSSAQITSPTSVTGRYLKIGRLLYIQGYWYKSSGNSGGASGYTLKGLPFSLTANFDFIPSGYMAVNGSPSTQTARFQVNASTYLELYGQLQSTVWSSSYIEFSFSGVLATLS